MEEVRLLVQEEGRAARNLIAFHVPVDQSQSESTQSGKVLVRKPPTSPRPLCDGKKEEGLRVSKRTCDSSKPGSRVRSASTGRDKKSELQARYWAFLFGNLQRAVDEIYQTCETDESVSECKEVILVLENYTRDFHSLIEWFKLKWEYENTPPPQRPTSLAWEVRKSSPGKVRNMIASELPTVPGTGKPRNLNSPPPSADIVAVPHVESAETMKDLLPEKASSPSFDSTENKKSGLFAGDVQLEDSSGSTLIVCKTVNDTEVKLENSKEPITVVSDIEIVKELLSPNTVAETEESICTEDNTKVYLGNDSLDKKKEDIQCNSTVDEINSENCQKETNEVLMIHQASQTDLEECVEDSDGLRFLSVGQPPPTPAPAPVPPSAPVAVSKPVTPSTLGKAPAVSRAPLAPARAGLRTSSAGPASRPQALSKPPYSTVSRLSSPYRPQQSAQIEPRSHLVSVSSGNTSKLQSSTNYSGSAAKIQSVNTGSPKPQQIPPSTSSLSRVSTSAVVTAKPHTNPRLMRSRTSTDVRPAGRGVALRRPPDSAIKVQRPIVGVRQNRVNVLPTSRGAPVPAKNNSVAENGRGPSLEQRSGSNSSLNSTASSGARSWADKVKGTETQQHTTVSVEVLPRTGCGQDDDDTQGWETVKGRSRSRISPANKVEGLGSKLSCSSGNIKSRLERKGSTRSHAQTRFHQPSAATSLPSLALREVGVRPPLPRKTPPRSSNSIHVSSVSKKMVKLTKKTPVLNNKVGTEKMEMNKEKSPGCGVVKKEVTDSMENLIDSEKTDETSKADTSDSDAMTLVSKEDEDDDLLLDSKLADILEERNLSEDELRKSKELSAEEEMLRKEIQELETTEIEVDTETDETETDGEATIGPEEDEEGGRKELLIEDSLTLEARYENMLEGMSWAERVDTLEQLQELVARHPGRALELHQKLSSPSRRRTLPETLRRFQAKQAQAKEKRDQLRLEKSQRLRELLNKVEEVKAAQAQLIEDKRIRLEMKLKRAEVNRKRHLKRIVRKAHDEEEKLKEIAFINELEAQNKRHDFMALCQEQEERLQGIQEERQRKVEEKAAKEAAAEERRRVLEAERQERLEKMQELRRKREERVGMKQLEREKERQELAREKARDREERLLALHAAQLATQEELQKKIQQKQEDSARRHEENIEHIRQRALESSIMRCSTDDVAPRLAPYDTQKLCQACNVLIGSEVYLLSHLRGKKHQEAVQRLHGTNLSKEEVTSYNIRHIVDAPADKIDPKIALDKERQKALKKRCKKIRLRMASRGQEYETKREALQKVDSPNKGRLQKNLKAVEKLHASQGKGQWPNNAVTGLERSLGEMNRILSKKNSPDQTAFQALNGFTILSNILGLAMDVPSNMAPYLPPKCFVTCCTTYSLACEEHVENCRYVLFSNKVSTILDLLLHRLSVLIPDRSRMLAGSSSAGGSTLPIDAIAGALMRLLALVMTHAGAPDDSSKEPSKGGAKEELFVRLQDVISYTVSVGIVDKLALYCGSVRDPIDSDPSAAQFLLGGLGLLTTMAARCSCGRRGGEDATQLVATLQVTELVGAVSMLYGMLLHQGAPPRGTASPPPALPSHTVAVTAATIRLLNRVAELDLPMFQSVLGAEGISLQFRHIASYLLWYCSYDKEKELLHEVVRVVGFFAVRNPDNQMMLQSGFMPTVLQQLCSLPFAYFSNPALSALLFPTLLACCSGNQQNRAILEQEVSYQLLEEFRNSEAAKSNRLVLLLSGTSAA
ncbi:S phase cyclin A-associated protein in the endoplasmic reticulum [Anabrus simplex]|uniref:S phase cyclin A-associated protein in the endoplasmic reticulum n=1 Tax=Anabrus simplex TaxID=316456 RepID=UPI0035A377D1